MNILENTKSICENWRVISPEYDDYYALSDAYDNPIQALNDFFGKYTLEDMPWLGCYLAKINDNASLKDKENSLYAENDICQKYSLRDIYKIDMFRSYLMEKFDTDYLREVINDDNLNGVITFESDNEDEDEEDDF